MSGGGGGRGTRRVVGFALPKAPDLDVGDLQCRGPTWRRIRRDQTKRRCTSTQLHWLQSTHFYLRTYTAEYRTRTTLRNFTLKPDGTIAHEGRRRPEEQALSLSFSLCAVRHSSRQISLRGWIWAGSGVHFTSLPAALARAVLLASPLTELMSKKGLDYYSGHNLASILFKLRSCRELRAHSSAVDTTAARTVFGVSPPSERRCEQFESLTLTQIVPRCAVAVARWRWLGKGRTSLLSTPMLMLITRASLPLSPTTD